MKIGILTYHRVVNDGSILQTYSLQHLLKTRLPDAAVEVIDYMPRKLRWMEYRGGLTKQPPFVRWDYFRKHGRKRRDLADFTERHLTLSPRLVSDDLERARTFLERQHYDAILVGSDTVWEVRDRGSSVPPAPNIYYLPNINGPRKLSFAASADPIHPEVARDEARNTRIAPHLEQFDFISYRDEATRDYLTSLGLASDRLRFLPDPTLLTDFGEIVAIHPQPARPVAAVSLPKTSSAAVGTQLEELGFAVADLGVTFDGPFPSLERLGERLGAFARLNMLVTDRFHSSIFTLKLSGCPVIFVENPAKWPEPNSKGRDLFQRLGIEFMVARHAVGPLPQGWLRKRLSLWEERVSDLPERFARLRQQAEPALQQMEKVLRGTPSS